MLSGLIENYMLGFVITAAPGAVLFEAIRRALSNRQSVYGFLLGNFSGMMLVIVLAFLGFSFLARGVFADLFYVLSGLLLLYIGVGAVLQKPKSKKVHESGYSAFGAGLVLATANPLSVLFWVSLVGKFLRDSQGVIWPLLYSLSVMCGAVTLFVLLVALVGRMQPLLKEQNLRLMSMIFGAVIAVYGIITISRAFQLFSD